MARKATAAAQPKGPELSTTSPVEFHAEQQLVHAHNEQLATLDLEYALDNEPYEYLRTVAYLQAATQMHVKVALVIGRACLLLKAHEPEGRFHQALEEAGIAARSAQKYMAIVRKFDGSEQRKLLAGRLATSKLLELVTEPDDTLDALVDGGTLAGKTLDDVDRMSVSELKDALRRERQEREEEQAANEEIVTKKDRKLNELAKKFRGWERSPVRDRAEELLRIVDEEALGSLSALKRLEESLSAIQALHNDEGVAIEPDVSEWMERAVEGVQQRLAELRDGTGV